MYNIEKIIMIDFDTQQGIINLFWAAKPRYKITYAYGECN